jgi:hypothetical protein
MSNGSGEESGGEVNTPAGRETSAYGVFITFGLAERVI